jgi:sulfur-carrier protein
MMKDKKMATIRIPTPLRAYTSGQSEVVVRGDNVSAVLADLIEQFPTLKTHLFNDKNELRPFVNLYLNDENIHELNGMETQVKKDDRLILLPSIAGGLDKR